MTWDGPAGAMRGYRAVAVAVVVAAVLVLHALQCARGLDTATPSAAASSTTSLASYDASAALNSLADALASADPEATDGHHAPADGGSVAVTACLLLLVIGGAVVLAAFQRWVRRLPVGRGLRHRPVSRPVTVRLLSLLCVSRV
ncbi:hypothetical protein AB0N38_28580 [Micromonospora aurantiaca]|uniref:hypothetical protein n=1 Tax=Micromonospora TaxID=1873 RepID=UPI00114D2FE7|nr:MULTISPECIES: hypothetical protein [Micromonospora]MDG4752752.1 hypothetical protein [Micromonospora sp. WMMD718]UFN92556.1 hypothetical protein LF814_21415 [Micromonospora aurantiaca]